MSRIITAFGLCAMGWILIAAVAYAGDDPQALTDTVEVFVYGLQSKNEALLREISAPSQYDAMAQERTNNNAAVNENIKVDHVEITNIDGDRASATAIFSQKHSKKKGQATVNLIRIDGTWKVTTPPKLAGE